MGVSSVGSWLSGQGNKKRSKLLRLRGGDGWEGGGILDGGWAGRRSFGNWEIYFLDPDGFWRLRVLLAWGGGKQRMVEGDLEEGEKGERVIDVCESRRKLLHYRDIRYEMYLLPRRAV